MNFILSFSAFRLSSYLANERKDTALDYKPPVPPHRNVGTRAMLPPQLPQQAAAAVKVVRFILHYIFLLPAMSVCQSVCMNLQISAIIKAKDIKVGMKVSVYHTQIKLIQMPRPYAQDLLLRIRSVMGQNWSKSILLVFNDILY